MADQSSAARVTVRYWAGARAAAGVDEEQVVAATLAQALTQVLAGRPQQLAPVLAVCSYVVSEHPVGTADPAEVMLTDGDVVEVLPPFAGGSGHDHAVRADSLPLTLPSWRPPLLELAVALTLAIGILLGGSAVWVGVVVTQLLLVLSWHHALDATDARSGAFVGGVLIAASDVGVLVAKETAFYGSIVAVVGVGFLLAVVQQLARRDGRAQLTVSLAATVSLSLIGALGAGWVVNLRLDHGQDLSTVAALAVAGAALGRLAPRMIGSVGALVLGTLVGAVVAAGLPSVGAGLGIAIGLAAAVPSALAAVVQARGDGRLAGWPVGATWPVLLAPGLVYLVIRLSGQ